MENTPYSIPWQGEGPQVATEHLPHQMLRVCRMEVRGSEPALLILMAMPEAGDCRWQKGIERVAPYGQSAVLWQDCPALPQIINYPVLGEELHTGEIYRCIHYNGEQGPVLVEEYRITWEDEKGYRPIVNAELTLLGERLRKMMEVLQQCRKEADQLKEENQILSRQLEKLQERQRDDRDQDRMRQLAKGWERRAKAAEKRLSDLENSLGEDAPKDEAEEPKDKIIL